MANSGVVPRPGERLFDRDERAWRKTGMGAALFGGAAAFSGIVDGVFTALRHHVTDCPDGHVTPDGGDPNCYTFPQAGLGVGIALLSIALLALIVIVGLIVSALPSLRPSDRLGHGPASARRSDDVAAPTQVNGAGDVTGPVSRG